MTSGARIAVFAGAAGLALGAGALAGASLPTIHEDSGSRAHAVDGHGETSGRGDGMPAVPAAAGLAVSEGGLTLVPGRTGFAAGVDAHFRFRIVDSAGAAVDDMDIGHEKRMHLIVVSRDMAHYRHVHPEPQPDGSWAVPLRLPEAGVYRAYADFSRAGRSHTLATDLFVDGALRARSLPAPSATAGGEGYTATVTARRDGAGEVDLAYRVATADGPVDDIEPYLGAAAHVVALREGDLAFTHAHAEPRAGDPAGVRVAVAPPSAGRYRVFIQFRHDGAVRTVAHTIEVRP